MPGHPRPGPVQRRQVTLTPEAAELVEDWAGRQGMSFSAALETLARLGLKQAPPDAFAGALEAAVRGAARDELARQTALLASASVDAHAAYALALLLATQGKTHDQALKIRQTAREAARRTVRLRASAQGRAELAALLTEPAPDPPGGGA